MFPPKRDGFSPVGEAKLEANRTVGLPYQTNEGPGYRTQRSGPFERVEVTGEPPVYYMFGRRWPSTAWASFKDIAIGAARPGGPWLVYPSPLFVVDAVPGWNDLGPMYNALHIGGGHILNYSYRISYGFTTIPGGFGSYTYGTGRTTLQFELQPRARKPKTEDLLQVILYSQGWSDFAYAPTNRQWITPTGYRTGLGYTAAVFSFFPGSRDDATGQTFADPVSLRLATEGAPALGFIPVPETVEAIAPWMTVGVITPTRWRILGAQLCTPIEAGGTGLNGQVFILATEDGGDTWSRVTVPALEVNMPAPPSPNILYPTYGSDRNDWLEAMFDGVWCVFTPEISVLATPSRVPGGTRELRLHRSTDTGIVFSLITTPTFSDPNSTHATDQDPHTFEYLGMGVGLLTTLFHDNVTNEDHWNLLRTTDYGATWTSVNKANLPPVASWQVGELRCERKKTATKSAKVYLPTASGTDYALWVSNDDGLTWSVETRVTTSDIAGRYNGVLDARTVQDERSHNFAILQNFGNDTVRGVLSVSQPWRFDDRITYEAE